MGRIISLLKEAMERSEITDLIGAIHVKGSDCSSLVRKWGDELFRFKESSEIIFTPSTSLSSLDRLIIHQICGIIGLHSQSHGDKQFRTITISKESKGKIVSLSFK